MILVVNNDVKEDQKECTFVLDGEAVGDMLSQAMWKQNSWLEKFNTCFAAHNPDGSVELTFSRQITPE